MTVGDMEIQHEGNRTLIQTKEAEISVVGGTVLVLTRDGIVGWCQPGKDEGSGGMQGI